VEDGPVADHLYVIRTGTVELVHGDQVVDVLEPGEAFGHPSLLTGLAPAFTVRAHEPTRCLQIPREQALRALGHPEGASFVALSLRERMVRAGHAAHALPELSTTHLAALVTRPPLFVDPAATAAEAARAMTAEHVTAALVRTDDGFGVVTDADLRERVLAAGRTPDTPIAAAMRSPALTIGADAVASEALVALLDAGAQEICVVAPDGRPAGLVGAADLLRSEHDPFVVRHQLARAPDPAALASTACAGLPRLLLALVEAGLDAGDVSRVLTAQSDAATARLIDFAIARHGPAPVPWAWLALGSGARRELTLASDQDNALAYADAGGPAADAYFAALAADVNAGLAACGFGADNAGVLARDPRWRMPAAAWARVLRDCLEHPDRSGLVRAAVSFDFRHVAGGLAIVPPLAAIIRDAPAHPDFIRRLARTAIDAPVALPRRGPFRREPAAIDLKRGAALPIANLARLHALSCGVTISGTLDRLTAAEHLGALDATTATALREAFLIVSGARIQHHAAAVRAGRSPDNRIEPAALPPLARAELYSALRAVVDAQRRLGVYAPLGI
jgi:CBS domain-containing protein